MVAASVGGDVEVERTHDGGEMRVIKKGRKQDGWSTEARCTGAGNGNGGCGAELLVEQKDSFRTESHARDETTSYTTFECPDCHVWTDLSESKVPHHVRDGLPLRAPGRTPRSIGD